ncbi:MAG: phosphatase PAP2 family protein [Chitinophagaceae bacterium]
MKRAFILCFFFLGFYAANSNGQSKPNLSELRIDTLHFLNLKIPNWYSDKLEKQDLHSLNISSVLIPVVGISYGVIALHQNSFKTLNISTRNELIEDHNTLHTQIDNYLQFSPAAAAIGLNIAGIHGKHSFIDELCVYAISNIIMGVTVEGTKHISHELRPDGSDYYSFPSGHTATAFAAAEWLRTEYWQRSPWIGIAGYAAATATGVLRVYNNRHWVSDVIAGAGFGFLSTRIAYELNPWVEKHILHDDRRNHTLTSYTFLEWHYNATSINSY